MTLSTSLLEAPDDDRPTQLRATFKSETRSSGSSRTLVRATEIDGGCSSSPSQEDDGDTAAILKETTSKACKTGANEGVESDSRTGGIPTRNLGQGRSVISVLSNNGGLRKFGQVPGPVSIINSNKIIRVVLNQSTCHYHSAFSAIVRTIV